MHTEYMASKTKQRSELYKLEWHYLIPGALGALIAFIFSASWFLAAQVFIAVVIGSLIGHWIAKHK